LDNTIKRALFYITFIYVCPACILYLIRSSSKLSKLNQEAEVVITAAPPIGNKNSN